MCILFKENEQSCFFYRKFFEISLGNGCLMRAMCPIYQVSIVPSATKIACFSMLDAVGIVPYSDCPRDLYKQSNCLPWNRHQSHFLPNWVNNGFRYFDSVFCTMFKKKKSTRSIAALQLTLQIIVIMIIRISFWCEYYISIWKSGLISFTDWNPGNWLQNPIAERCKILQLILRKNVWRRRDTSLFLSKQNTHKSRSKMFGRNVWQLKKHPVFSYFKTNLPANA